MKRSFVIGLILTISLCMLYIDVSDATLYTYQLRTIKYLDGWKFSDKSEPMSSYEVDDGKDDIHHLSVTTHVYIRELFFPNEGRKGACIISYMHVYKYYENGKHVNTEFYPSPGDCD